MMISSDGNCHPIICALVNRYHRYHRQKLTRVTAYKQQPFHADGPQQWINLVHYTDDPGLKSAAYKDEKALHNLM
jgi:iron-sulfur cluster repair protein YtfE (RIC family)